MINKCTFIGNLGKDPDYKVLESGHKVASFSIACSRKVKNKENGETKEYTEWIPIVAWDNLAEIISQLARKGSQVYVEGGFRTRSYEAEGTGEKRYVSEIWACDFRLLGRKAESSSAPLPTSPDDFGSQSAPDSAPAPSQPAQAAPQQPTQGTLNMTDEKDDLPF